MDGGQGFQFDFGQRVRLYRPSTHSLNNAVSKMEGYLGFQIILPQAAILAAAFFFTKPDKREPEKLKFARL
jgi:hypothetical protein